MVRVLRFTGGLGNQIFEYAFFLYLKNKYPKDHIFICYNKTDVTEHNRFFEITKFFNTQLPEPSKLAIYVWIWLSKLNKYADVTRFYDPPGPTIQNEHAIFYYAYHCNKFFIPSDPKWITFKKPMLSKKNANLLQQIKDSNSVFIHIRRGDYLSPIYYERFKDICTTDYYKTAINIMHKRYDNAQFFVFSDDPEWVKEHIVNMPPHAHFVDWNKKADSYLDMYLMAHCKAGITANSTFSYWGARLIQKKFVIYPKKWMNGKMAYPNLFEDYWMGI